MEEDVRQRVAQLGWMRPKWWITDPCLVISQFNEINLKIGDQIEVNSNKKVCIIYLDSEKMITTNGGFEVILFDKCKIPLNFV